MSLWTRLTAWWEARKAVRRGIAARKQQDRVEAKASLARAIALGAGAHMSVHHGSSGYEAYHGSSGSDCSPGTSGDCSGTGV